MLRPIFLLLLISASAGCTNVSHQRVTVGQASTLDHLYRQQVVDNLAKFTNDPNALPHFSIPSQGATSVNDNAGFTTGFNFDPFGLTGYGINPAAQRGLQVSWTMQPVSDPARLGRMRALYQQAVAAPWFSHGKRLDVPKHHNCLVVGHFCGTYVWVSPDCGSDQLTNLTLSILDAALNDPPEPAAPPTKTVEIVSEYDKNGQNPKPVQRKETFESLLEDTDKSAVPKATAPRILIPQMRSQMPYGTGPLGFRQSLDFLAPSNRQR